MTNIRELDHEEIEEVHGGWFWIALPIIVGGGYTWGKDLAETHNAQDQQECKC
ncbi:MAG: hypothetical protein AAGK66_12655 [Pseudomonadota bacterium]